MISAVSRAREEEKSSTNSGISINVTKLVDNKKEEEMIDKVEGNKMTEEDEVNIVGSISIREEKKDEVPKEENKIDNE